MIREILDNPENKYKMILTEKKRKYGYRITCYSIGVLKKKMINLKKYHRIVYGNNAAASWGKMKFKIFWKFAIYEKLS